MYILRVARRLMRPLVAVTVVAVEPLLLCCLPLLVFIIAIKRGTAMCRTPKCMKRSALWQGVLPLIDAVNYSIALKASFKGSSEISYSSCLCSSPCPLLIALRNFCVLA